MAEVERNKASMNLRLRTLPQICQPRNAHSGTVSPVGALGQLPAAAVATQLTKWRPFVDAGR